MSGPNFNIIDRLPLTRDLMEVDVYSVNDLPAAITAPDGISRIPLAGNTKYIFHNTMVIPRLLIPIITQFTQSFEQIMFVGARNNVNLLFNGDNTPHIWGRDIGALFSNGITFVDISNNGLGRGTVLYDLVGGNGGFSAFAATPWGGINFKKMGSFVDIGFFLGQISQDFGSDEGYVIRVTPEGAADGVSHLISSKRFVGNPLQPANRAPFFNFIGSNTETSFIGCSIALANASNSFLHIDSGSSQGNYQIIGNAYESAASSGQFFRPDVNISINSAVAADVSITGFFEAGALNQPVASVADASLVGGFGSRFTTTVANNFHRNDAITHTSFSNGAYNGAFTITNVISSTVYEVAAITFISTDTGDATVGETGVNAAGNGLTRGQVVRIANSAIGIYNGLKTVLRVSDDQDTFFLAQVFAGTNAADVVSTRLTTAVTHPMVEGETQTISATTSYNGTTQILKATATTFDIPVEFVASETGTVVSTGKTETALGVNAFANGAQKDSMAIGSAFANDNATATVIAVINTFVDLNLNASAAVGINTERFTLTNTTTAELRYDGDEPFSGRIAASISASSAGSSQEFHFRVVVNGSVTTDDIQTATELSSTNAATSLIAPLNLVKNDLVRLQVENIDGTSNIVIRFISIEVSS